MTALLKQRLVGAIVLISLGIIFIPMLLTGTGGLTTGEMPTNIPPKPLYEIQAPAVLPLEQKNLPEPVLEPIPEAVAPSSDSRRNPVLGTPAPAEKTMDTAALDAKVKAEPEVKPESIPSTTIEPIKPEKVEQPTQKSTDKQATKPKPTTTAKVESTKPKQPIVSGWVVQLGSFSVERNAIKLRDKLRKKGHASFVEAYKRDGKTSYRVRVGPELTRELASELKAQLKKETKIDGLVMAFPDK